MDNHGSKGYESLSFSRNRDLMVDAGWNGRRKHMIHGFIELDVTDARRIIREHKARTGEALSFTAFLLACLGQAVAMDRRVHASRAWRRRLVLFDDVDAGLMVETEVDGQKFPIGHVVRAVDKRMVQDMHDEIRAVQKQPSLAAGMRLLRFAAWMPGLVRRLMLRAVDRSPHLQRQCTGTVGVSSVGMFGTHGGWGLGMPVHTLSVTVGGIAAKPGVVQGRVEVREYLQVTISFNHDIVDGAPAARFAQGFADLVERGYGLEGLAAEACPAPPAAAFSFAAASPLVAPPPRSWRPHPARGG